jgi:hypothetical protein
MGVSPSPLPPRHRANDGATRHGQPQTPFDEEPTSSAPGGLGHAISRDVASAPAACHAGVPTLNDTISNQGFKDSGVLVHGLLL